MGGGIGYNLSVAAPNVFDALVLFSPVSANYVQNFNRNTRNIAEVRDLIAAHYGLPENNPDFWSGISPLNSLQYVQDPVVIHHGLADITCPIKWTDTAVAEYRKSGVRVVYHVYKGEQHIFKKKWKLSMQRSVNFLKTEISKVSN
jgi:dipeptidyl aminopeptidase/acylaminoacyl peptidase